MIVDVLVLLAALFGPGAVALLLATLIARSSRRTLRRAGRHRAHATHDRGAR
ncbi:MAG: hypothetical protein ACRDRZ_12655 [Pseudonocardiaceae bacterium]